MKQYDKTVYNKLWKEHRRSYLIRELLINNPRLFNLSVNLINSNKVFYNLAKRVLINLFRI